MADILEELSAMRRADAELAAKSVSYGELIKRIERMSLALDFRAAFSGSGINIIAELKKASPSEGLIRADFDPVAISRTYEENGAVAMSVLCEPHRFLGSEEYLRLVRETVKAPLIYKDFLTTDYQIAAARAAGADACLLIAAVLDDRQLSHLLELAHSLSLTALVETHTEDEVKRAVDVGARLVGVNCRDLRTFKTDPNITAELVAKIPSGITRIGESGIKTHEDILKVRSAGADGFLIGTTLMRAEDPGAKLRELIG